MLQTLDTCGRGWLCGYDDRQHPLHNDYIRRPYPDDTEACRCLPGMRCGSHCMNRNMQEDCDKAYQCRAEERAAMEEEHKYHFNWWMDF